MFRMRRCSPTFLKLTTICDVSHVISFTRPSSPLFFPTREEGLGTRLYIGSVFRRPVYWLCFQETSIIIGSVFRRPVYWLCFQETSILALFSGDQYIGSVQETSILALFSGDQYIGSVFRRQDRTTKSMSYSSKLDQIC